MSLATLNGVTVTACRVSLPAYGLWTADVECASGDVMTGEATLIIDDLTLKGTIISGGAYEARTRYRIVAGAGGWGRVVAAKSYANDLGVKPALVLTDAARDCGETMGAMPTEAIGPSFVRASAPASRVLHELAPQGWYVDEAGVTQIGRRPPVTYTGAATRITDDHAQGRLEIAPPAIAALLPGAVVDGLEAVDVEHSIEGGKLRTVIYGRGVADTARLPEALRRIVETFTADHKFYASWEYRVVARNGERLELQPVRVSTGMPSLSYVRIRPGVAGGRAHPKLGSLVLVSFVNGDPSRHVVTSFDEQDGPGWIPDEIALQAGTTGASPTEHATSAEALVAAVQQVLASIGPLIGGGFGTAVTALSVAPAFDAIVPLIAARTLAASTRAAIALALAGKTADTLGDTPNLGWPNVRGG